MLSEIGDGRIPAGMEVWDLYDVNRQKTGETCSRGCTLPDGRFHLVVNVCVFNDQGAMLIQQRQSSKVPYPDLWTLSSGGCAIAGETSAMAASRELQEEIGITSDFTGQRPLLTISGTNSFSDYYLLPIPIFIPFHFNQRRFRLFAGLLWMIFCACSGLDNLSPIISL